MNNEQDCAICYYYHKNNGNEICDIYGDPCWYTSPCGDFKRSDKL